MKISINYNLKRIVIAISIVFTFNIAVTQNSNTKNQEKIPFTDRISVGGAFGLGFGSNSVLVDISPILGFSVTENFVVGLGLTYKYYQLDDYYYNLDDKTLSDFKNNIYGGSIFARYFLSGINIPIIENMFIHSEVEPLIFINDYKLVLSNQGKFIDGYGNYYIKENEKITITSYFLGGGLRQMITERTYLYLEVLWNFNEELYTPYSNPRIRIGISAGF